MATADKKISKGKDNGGFDMEIMTAGDNFSNRAQSGNGSQETTSGNDGNGTLQEDDTNAEVGIMTAGDNFTNGTQSDYGRPEPTNSNGGNGSPEPTNSNGGNGSPEPSNSNCGNGSPEPTNSNSDNGPRQGCEKNAYQKKCMHVHRFPYLYVPYDGKVPWEQLRKFATSLDEAINVAQGQANIQHVYKIVLVSGKPMCGCNDKEQQFLKIYFNNRSIIKKAADLLLNGAVLQTSFISYEFQKLRILEKEEKNGTRSSACCQDPNCEKNTKQLRRRLKIIFNSGLKWKKNACNFRFMYCFVFFVQIIKVALITHQMFHFADDRGKFSSVVNRGDLVLRHLLLEHWDASWETLPYPRAQGDFAVYTMNELENGINYAVKNFYNAEREAIGYYIRTADDKMTATIKYFDFPGFHDNTSIEADITISEITFPIEKGLMAEKTVENETIYSYDITREIEHYNISDPIKRMLSTILYFKLHSVRFNEDSMKGTCLRIEGSVEFADNDNNGQVLVDLKTSSKRIICKDMNLSISDWQLQHTTVHVGVSVIILSFSSIVLTVVYLVFVLCTYSRTKQYMKGHYQSYYNDGKAKDLPTSEYCRFFPFWDIITFLSDICTLIGTFLIVQNDKHGEWLLEELDLYIMLLGLGSLLAWLSLLRFFEFYSRFNLLFRTIYKSCPDIITYLICVSVLYVGFLFCGYIVMAPYHVKFKTPSDAAETLFSIINGDEIYTTLALLESEWSGGYWVRWFSRLYVVAFVAIFTILGINLFIALFLNAYESIKKCQQEEREVDPIGKLLNVVLKQKRYKKSLHNALYNTMNNTNENDALLKQELSKFLYIPEGDTQLVLNKNRTLQAFIKDGGDEDKPLDCGSVKCYWDLC